ncbi:MAG: hypothetical protein HY966_02755 [Ignavibacteriales bacterium]|nr:hypothetical protein [Ignavibacteriales bacterium]
MGQTSLTVAFLITLTVIVLNANKMILDSEQDSISGMALRESADIAESLISEIQRKKFDQNAVVTYYQAQSEFTSASKLGPESGESISPSPDVWPYKSIKNYTDADDYNGYKRTVDTPTLQGYTVACKVYYVTNTNFESVQTSQQYFKRITVTVEHSQYLKAVTFSALVAY